MHFAGCSEQFTFRSKFILLFAFRSKFILLFAWSTKFILWFGVPVILRLFVPNLFCFFCPIHRFKQ